MGMKTDSKAEEAIKSCVKIRDIAQKSLGWIDDNADALRLDRSALTKEFRNHKFKCQKLETALHRPMCVGVFGASQAGKSYLIGALARDAHSPLLTTMGGKAYNYLADINPEGGKESTGVVTRFTTQEINAPDDAPVVLRLLSQTDIIKIIGNSYLSDCLESRGEPPTAEAVGAHLDELDGAKRDQPVDTLNEADIHDLGEYFDRYFSSISPHVRVLRHHYWNRAASLAPYLVLADRAKLFSVVWNGVEQFTELYLKLIDALKSVNFSEETYCAVDALIPRIDSIINVDTLHNLNANDENKILLRSPGGDEAKLDRAVVTALIAELTIRIDQRPWDFFDHTDLLDFPGARSREQIEDIRAFLSKDHKEGEPPALSNLYLRGKVAYLFDRYSNDQELNSMVLCVGESVQEVNTIPKMISDWVDVTHGSTVEERAKQMRALFLCLTKFDMEFEEKAGADKENVGGRWSNRIQASFLNFLGKSEEWPHKWDGEDKPFQNLFWIRNPSVKAKSIIDYDGDTEVKIRDASFIANLRDGFVNNDLVRTYFEDPEIKWDAGLALNDGGVSLLAEKLRPVCNPDLKRLQIEGQLRQINQRINETLRPYFVGGDIEAELAKKREAVSDLIRDDLRNCFMKGRFGELIRALHVNYEEMVDLFQSPNSLLSDDPGPEISKVDYISEDPLAGLDDLFDGEDAEDVAEEPTDSRGINDKASMFSAVAFNDWSEDLNAMISSPRQANYYGISQQAFSLLISELLAGAHRLKLKSKVEQQVRSIMGYRMKGHEVASRPAMITANIINDYVNRLGFNRVKEEEIPTVGKGENVRNIFAPRSEIGAVLEISEDPIIYRQIYFQDWVVGFMRIAELNVRDGGGIDFDIEQNSRLKEILDRVSA